MRSFLRVIKLLLYRRFVSVQEGAAFLLINFNHTFARSVALPQYLSFWRMLLFKVRRVLQGEGFSGLRLVELCRNQSRRVQYGLSLHQFGYIFEGYQIYGIKDQMDDYVQIIMYQLPYVQIKRKQQIYSRYKCFMFKIKKTSKRVIAGRDALLQTNPNQDSLPTPQEQRPKRPQSVRLQRKHISQPQIQPYECKQMQQSTVLSEMSETTCLRVIDRTELQDEVRRLSTMMFKDRMAVFGALKEDLIKRVTNKYLTKGQPEGKERRQWLRELIEGEMVKLERGKYVRDRYEISLKRIQGMLEERLCKLCSMR